MNKKILYCVLFIFAILNAMLLYKVSQAKNEIKNPNETLLKISKEYYNTYVTHSQLNNNFKLNKDLILTNLANKKIVLGSIAPAGVKMIIRSSETGCGVCIENELKIIKNFAEKFGAENIAIITTHSNVRRLEVFKMTNQIPFELYTCPALGMPFETAFIGSQKPFIFILDSTLTTKHFFIPEVSEPAASNGYYSALYVRYFKNHEKIAKIQ